MPESPQNQASHLVNRAQDAAAGVANSMGRPGRFVGDDVHLAGLSQNQHETDRKPPGSAPGIESTADADVPPTPGQIGIQCLDYGPDRVESAEVTDLEAWLGQKRPDWSRVRWVNINGLHPYVVKRFKEHYQFHTLAAEDVLHTPQRPKLESFKDHLFIVLRMLMLGKGQLLNEQISIFFYQETLLTFQEREGDVWNPIRDRINKPASRLRTHDASYLLYALLDAVVDHCFPILEEYGDAIEGMEHDVIQDPAPSVQQRIHALKRELALLRRVIWPLREVLNELGRSDCQFVSEYVRTYLRDVYDHTVQVIDIVETYREMAAGLNDLYMSSMGNRMNEIMKVLTIMASFFIPITFLAGVYGMNFEHIPELKWAYSYGVFWGVCTVVTLGLAIYFFRKGWLGRR